MQIHLSRFGRVGVGAILSLSMGLCAVHADAQSSPNFSFQFLYPAFLKTRISPAFWQDDAAKSPAAYDPSNGDFQSQFTSPSGKQVTVVVKAPVTSSEYDVPPITAQETAYDYLNNALYDSSGRPRTKTVIKFPKHTYNINFPLNSNCTSPTDHQPKFVHWQLPSGASDLVIDGQGSTVNFSDFCLGLNLPNVKRVMFRNFTFAWPNLQIATVGTITAVGGNGTTGYTYDVHIDPAHVAKLPNVIAAINSWDAAADHWDIVNINDNVAYGSGIPSSSGVPLTCVETPAEEKKTGCTVKRVPSFGVLFKVGESVLLRHYDYASAVSASGDDITFDTITLKNLIGFGFGYSQGRGFRITNTTLARMANEPISAAGNATIMTQSVSGDIDIDHSSFNDEGDDAFDLNTPIMRYTPTQVTNNTPMNTFTFNASTPNQLQWPGFAARAGDVIALFDNALVFRGTAKVESVDSTDTLLTLDRNIDSTLSQADFIAGDVTSAAGARYVISDNTFRYTSARALLLQTPFGWVNNNRFIGQTQKEIYVLASQYWGEGPGAQELVISNNTFDGTGGHQGDFIPLDVIGEAADFPNAENEITGGSSPAPAINQNIVVANNSFTSDQITAVVNLSSVNNVAFSGNRFTLAKTLQPAETDQFPVAIHDASNIEFDVKNTFSPGWLSGASCTNSRLLALSDPAPIVSTVLPNACGIPATVSGLVFVNH